MLFCVHMPTSVRACARTRMIVCACCTACKRAHGITVSGHTRTLARTHTHALLYSAGCKQGRTATGFPITFGP